MHHRPLGRASQRVAEAEIKLPPARACSFRNRLLRRPFGTLLIVAVVSLAGQPVRAQESGITADMVLKSIDRGIAYLKKEQRRDGSWPDHAGQPGGVTALCTLALLAAGVPQDDPAIKTALAHLRTLGKPKMVYTTSLQTMVFCAAEPAVDNLLIERNAQWLEQMQIKDTGPNQGAWAYSSSLGKGDRSNSQFALLALHEAERVGVDVEERTWRLALRYWLETQRHGESWNYSEGAASTGSMTCAGIASVVIASGKLSEGDAQVTGDGRVLCCGEKKNIPEIEKAVAWLDRNFSVRRNPTDTGIGEDILSKSWLLYYLYGLERVGRLTGKRFIGKHDWYREGAEYLISPVMQDTFEGYWKGVGHAETDPRIATAFALLFLGKGRRPVVLGKLEHCVGDDWNRHRNDAANLTRFVERQWKRDLTWQVLKPTATAADLLETPVLLITGQESLALTQDQKDNLRTYVQQGGFLFAVANTNGDAFSDSFKELMRELFPDSQLRLLPRDHPIWMTEQPVDPAKVPLYGIQACCRTSVVFCPKDLSCLWELSLQRKGHDAHYPNEVKQHVAMANAVGANVLAYATGRELKRKLDRPNLPTDEPQSTLPRGTVSVLKLQHTGGSDDAPAALPNLMRRVGEATRIHVNSKTRLLDITDGSLSQHPIVFMHGRRKFSLSPTERETLGAYLRRGGFLLADSICASREFADSFRREMEIIFPDQRLARIPVDHDIIRGTRYRGYDLTTVTLRDPQARAEGDPLSARLSKVAPLLEGLELDGRYAVVFSPYDISCALENSPSLECKGYIRQDAAKIGVNVLLYALQQ
jgi:hypothetical protein